MEQPASPFSTAGLANNFEANFSFRKRNERIDWKKLASVDIAKLSQDLDFHILQDNIVHITFCDIEHEMDATIDPNYVKLFTLAQLIIEYLLHSQEYLANVIQLMEEKLKHASENLEAEKTARAKDQKLITELRKENKKRKQQLSSQQQYFEAVCKESSQCPHCPKVFIGPSYLQSHLQRRHPEFAKEKKNEVDLAEQQNMKIDSLEKELQEIKEKMKVSEIKLTTEKSVQVTFEEAQTDKSHNEILKSMEEWKENELQRHKEELTQAKNLFQNELRQLQEKHERSENALQELQKKYTKINSSHLESIENSLQHRALLKEKENDEVAALKEQLKTKLNYMESDIEKKLKNQEKGWKAKFKKIKEEHASEIEKLNIDLKNTMKELSLQQEKNALREKEYEEKIYNLVKSQKTEKLQRHEKQLESPAKLQTSVVFSPKKEVPPPPLPRTCIPSSEIAKSPMKERRTVGIVKSSRVQNALQMSPGLLDGLRTELSGLLDDKLKACGVGKLSVTPAAVRKANVVATTERKALSKKYKGFERIRNNFEQLVDEMAKKKLQQQAGYSSQESQNVATKSMPSTPVKSNSVASSSPVHTSLGNSVQAPVTPSPKISYRPILVTPGSKTRTDQKVTPKKLSFRTPVQSSMPEAEESTTSEEEIHEHEENLSDEENSDDFCDINTRKLTWLGSLQNSKSPPQPAVRKSLAHEKVLEDNKENDEDDEDNDDETLDSSDDDFGSNEEKDSSVHDNYQPIYVRPPTGQLVSRLTQSIEHQLQGRHAKPPAGSVDIMPDAKTNFVRPNVESTKTEEDDDSLLSLEEQLIAFEAKFQEIDKTKETPIQDKWQNAAKADTHESLSGKKDKQSTSWDSDDDISFEEIK